VTAKTADAARSSSTSGPTTTSGPTVGAIVDDRRLGLTVLAGSQGRGRQVLAAHTSELRDPTPWLHGGELLMTTGLSLDADETALADYVDRLADAGVACLAVGTGETLTHAQVPPSMVTAAERRGLPLLEVPERTAFLAVTEAVYAGLARAQYGEQMRALDAQRTLTAAAVHPGGVTAIAASFAALTGTAVLVTDLGGAPLAAAPASATSLLADLRPQLDRLRAHGLAATASVQEPGRDVRVQPLGAQRLRGFVACALSTPPGPFERQLTAAAVGLLTLELERLQTVGDVDRQRRAQAARRLLAGPVSDDVADQLLSALGLRAQTVRAVTVRGAATSCGATPDTELAVELLTRLLPSVLVTEHEDGVTLLVPDPPEDLAELVTRATSEPGPRLLAAGLGGEVRPGCAERSARQSRRGAQLAREHGGVVDVQQLASTRLLLTLPSSGAVLAFADAVLGPVEQSGARGDALLASLRVFLECNGVWDEAAARLGVHRHTLRQRIRRVEQLTGRRADSGRDRMELLLAFEARDVAGDLD
jgi:PucR family transcriptional regulator, purine catabolism regulatory protein